MVRLIGGFIFTVLAIWMAGPEILGTKGGKQPASANLPPVASPNQSNPDQYSSGQYRPVDYQRPADNATGQPVISIGAFNIEKFGRSKMRKSDVVPVLVDIVRRFDIIAIQELQDASQQTIPEFMRLVNQGGYRYAPVVGPRQKDPNGTSSYAEQAVYIYNTDKIELVGPQPYVARDYYQIMHRAPFVAHFRCITPPQQPGFSFVLMNVHTDPDDVPAEFNELRNIIAGVYPNHPGEDDFILLGDLNGSPRQFQPYQWMRSQISAVPDGVPTNTAGTKTLDNIVFNGGLTSEFTGNAGVLNLQTDYRLTASAADRVSDHLPVWAIFSAFEKPQPAVTQNPPQVRR